MRYRHTSFVDLCAFDLVYLNKAPCNDQFSVGYAAFIYRLTLKIKCRRGVRLNDVNRKSKKVIKKVRSKKCTWPRKFLETRKRLKTRLYAVLYAVVMIESRRVRVIFYRVAQKK